MIFETVRRGSLRRLARRSEGAAKLLSRDSDGIGRKASTDNPMRPTIPKHKRIHESSSTKHPLVERIRTPHRIHMPKTIHNSIGLEVIDFCSEIVAGCEDSPLIDFPYLVEETLMD